MTNPIKRAAEQEEARRTPQGAQAPAQEETRRTPGRSQGGGGGFDTSVPREGAGEGGGGGRDTSVLSKDSRNVLGNLIAKGDLQPEKGSIFMGRSISWDEWRRRNRPAAVPKAFDEQLPIGAVGKDEYGRPYYGGSSPMSDWWKGAKARFFGPVGDAPDLTEGVFDDEDFDWGFNLQSAGKVIEEVGDFGSNLGEILRSAGAEEGEDPNVFTYLGRASTELLPFAGALFDTSEDVVSQTLNVMQGLVERGATPELDSPLPDLIGDEQLTWLDRTPIGLGYNLARGAFARQAGEAVQNDWDTGRVLYTDVHRDLSKYVRENFPNQLENSGLGRWVAAHVLYDGAYETTAREEVKRKIQSGMNPYLATLEVEDPIAELVGGVILDPFNLVSLLGKGLKLRGALSLASNELVKPLDEFAQIVGRGTVTEAGAVRDFERLAKASLKADLRVEQGLDAGRTVKSSFRTVFGLLEPTQGARRARATKRQGEFLQILAHNIPGKRENPDLFMEMTKAWLETTSKVVEERMVGWQTLHTMLNRGDIASMTPFYSHMGREAGVFLRKMAGENPQAFVKKMREFKSPVEAAEFWGKKFDKVLDEMYPDYIKRLKDAGKLAEGEKIPAHIAAAAKFHDATRGIYNPINSVFAGAYMGLNPGYVIRNFWNDSLTIWADEGIGAFRHPLSPQRYADEAAEWMGGVKLQAAERQIGGIAAGEPTNWASRLPGIKGGNWVERKNAQRVVGKATSDAMNKLLNKGLDIDPLLKAGMSRSEANQLKRLVISFKGDVGKAFDTIRQDYSRGTMNLFRNGAWMDTKDWEIARQHGLLDDYLEIFRTSETWEEATRRMDEVVEGKWAGLAKRSTQIDPRLDPSHGTTAWAEVMERGLAFGVSRDEDVEIIHGYVGANQNAMKTLQETLNQAQQLIIRQTGGDDNVLNAVLNTVVGEAEDGGRIFVRDILRDGKIDNKWRKTFIQMREKANAMQDYLDGFANNRRGMEEAWFGYNLGEMPAEVINKKTFLEYAWRKYRADGKFVSISWRNDIEGYGRIALGLMTEAGGDVGAKALADIDHSFTISRMWDELDTTREGANALKAAMNKGSNRASVYALADMFPGVPKLSDAARTTREKDPALLNIINQWNSQDPAKRIVYESLDDVPPEVAQRAFGRRAFGENWELPDAPRPTADMITHNPDVTPVGDQLFKQTAPGVRRWNEKMKDLVRRNFDNVVPVAGDERKFAALEEAEKIWNERVVTSRFAAGQYATATRDFILHDYADRTGLDMALSYVFPYHFWYSRTYNNWIRGRLLTDSSIISKYFQYRTTMEKIHADLPEWWRYNVNSNEVLGIDSENPLFFNLEATLNPMKGLIETDFNDPKRRVNWWTNFLDGIDNYGPTTWTPIQMLTAYGLYLQGEDEAAARWGGRLIPQTQQIKSATALMNIGGEGGVELDPFVHMFSGGVGVYERRRAGRILSEMVKTGQADEAAALDAARTQSGPLWEAALAQEADRRAPSVMGSYLFGVGFKGRTPQDLEIDQFYEEYYKMMDRWEDLKPTEIREGFDWLRERFPFMDTMLLSRKAGWERERSYAYNVLGRVPPGQKDDIFKMAGLDPGLYNEFYKNKGDLTKFDAGEQDDFMDLIVDLGAILDIPDTATKKSWREAQDAYSEMSDRQEELFGEDIRELINLYFDTLKDGGQGEEFLNKYPQVADALDYQTQQSWMDPRLRDYYISIKRIEDYMNAQMWDKVTAVVGEDIFDKWDQYYELKLIDEKGAKAFYKENEEIFDTYRDLRDGYRKIVAERLVTIEGYLNEGVPAPMRDNDELTSRQQQLAEQIQAEDPNARYYNYTWQDWQQVLSPAQTRLVEDWIYDGEMPEALFDSLERTAGGLGLDSTELMLAMLENSFDPSEE